MEIIIKRTIQREDCTIGCVQLYLSGKYESKLLEANQLRASPWGSSWVLLGDTLEHRAIPWVDKPLIGEFAPERVPDNVAIPEGKYRIDLYYSEREQCKLLKLSGVAVYKTAKLRPGTKPLFRHADIIVGHLEPVPGGHPTDNPVMKDERSVIDLLCELIEEAQRHGEAVTVTVRSPRGWTGPIQKIKRGYRKAPTPQSPYPPAPPPMRREGSGNYWGQRNE